MYFGLMPITDSLPGTEDQPGARIALEAPSPFAHFVLVSSAPGRLLPTIPSRCQAVRFGPVPSGRIVEVLVGEGVDAQVAAACAHLAGGDVVKARWLAGEGAAQRAEA